MAAHSKIGPSAAKKWLTCTGSIDLIDFLKKQKKIPLSTTNDAAERGTAVHFVGEQALLGKHTVNDFKNVPIKVDGMTKKFILTKKNLDDAKAYVRYCRETLERAGGIMCVEETYDLSKKYNAPIGGTTDCTILGDNYWMYVIDYKNGVGPVVARNNPQTMIYALGAYYKHKKNGRKIRKIKMVIFQPNARDNLPTERTQCITVKALLRWEQKKLIPALNKIMSGKGILNPSDDACQWCEAKAFCKALKENKPKLVSDMIVAAGITPVVESGSLPGAADLTQEELIQCLQNADHVIKFYEECKALAKKMVEKDVDSLPGFALRSNRGNRKYIAKEAMVKAFKKNGIDPDEVSIVVEDSFLTLTDMEKYLKEDKGWSPKQVSTFMGEVTDRKVSSYSLIPVQEVTDDFADFDPDK